jgi:3-carboxy-cis,cis-muconate cycloisomerase
MRANLAATGGLAMAEAVAARLAPAVGRSEAQRAVARAAAEAAAEAAADATAGAAAEAAAGAAEAGFAGALLADPVVAEHLTAADIAEALTAANWLGAAGTFVDRALAAYRRAEPAP